MSEAVKSIFGIRQEETTLHIFQNNYPRLLRMFMAVGSGMEHVGSFISAANRVAEGVMWKLNRSHRSEDGGRTWSRYKVETVAMLPQSFLSYLSFIIVLCLNRLWQLLNSGFIQQLLIWKSLFANMTIQVSTAVDVSLEQSSTAVEIVEVPSLRISSRNIEEDFELEPLMSSGVVEVAELLELLQEEQEDLEESEGDQESNNSNTAFSDSDNSSAHHQAKLLRRDSDTSDVSSSDGNDNNNCNAVSPEVAERIISQVEVMFSDEHLSKDGFLLKHVRRRSDGFVSLKLVAGLRKVKQISRDFPVVMTSLRKSSKLEVNSEGTKIRRIEPLTLLLKSLPTAGQNKDKKESTNKENATKEKEVPSTNATYNKDISDEQVNRNMNGRNNRNNNRQAQRKISTVSTGSSTGGSRHGSFCSGKLHPAELFRNVMSCSSSNEDSPQTPRRRGGSLPIPTGNHRLSSHNSPSPNSSPPNATIRPKSNSYCEGQNINGPATTTMSPWLMKRKQSTRNSEGSIVLSGVVRQPRGPDGTKGFPSGYRTLILREKDTLSNSQTTLSA